MLNPAIETHDAPDGRMARRVPGAVHDARRALSDRRGFRPADAERGPAVQQQFAPTRDGPDPGTAPTRDTIVGPPAWPALVTDWPSRAKPRAGR